MMIAIARTPDGSSTAMARTRQPRLAKSTPAPAQPNRSLIDGLTCLSVLAESPRPLSNLELAGRLGIDLTRSNRLLKSLAYVGFARQTTGRKYVIGPAMDVLAAHSLMQPARSEHLLPPLRALRSMGLDVAYGALWQRQVVYLYFGAASHPQEEAGLSLDGDRLFPAVRSSIGHVLLAQLPEAHVRELYGGGAGVDGYPGGLKGLLADLRQTRERGHAVLTPEQTSAATSIAFPVGRPVYAAVALAGSERKHTEATLTALRDAAAALSVAE
jgi:DNA-binding IclR family transcriptional regulator